MGLKFGWEVRTGETKGGYRFCGYTFLLIIWIKVAFEAIIMGEFLGESVVKRERPEGNGACPYLWDRCVFGTGRALGRAEAHRKRAERGGGYTGY